MEQFKLGHYRKYREGEKYVKELSLDRIRILHNENTTDHPFMGTIQDRFQIALLEEAAKTHFTVWPSFILLVVSVVVAIGAPVLVWQCDHKAQISNDRKDQSPIQAVSSTPQAEQQGAATILPPTPNPVAPATTPKPQEPATPGLPEGQSPTKESK